MNATIQSYDEDKNRNWLFQTMTSKINYCKMNPFDYKLRGRAGRKKYVDLILDLIKRIQAAEKTKFERSFQMEMSHPMKIAHLPKIEAREKQNRELVEILELSNENASSIQELKSTIHTLEKRNKEQDSKLEQILALLNESKR